MGNLNQNDSFVEEYDELYSQNKNVKEFKQKVVSLLEQLKHYKQREHYKKVDVKYNISKLNDILLILFKTNQYEESHQQIYNSISKELGTKATRQYIYNKTGYLTRFRALRQKKQTECQNCGAKLTGDNECGVCYAHVEYNTKQGTHQQDQMEKMQLFMTYFQGICSIPYFLRNYLNNVLFREQLKGKKLYYDKRYPENSYKNKYYKIDFPLNNQIFFKKRSDISKQTQFQIDVWPQQQIKIPIWSFKEFKKVIMSYRKESNNWPNSSYLPRDAIYLRACYIYMYKVSIPLFSEKDKKIMLGLYQKLLQVEVDRRNKFVIDQVLIGFVQNIERFQKYQKYLYLVKNVHIDSQLTKIIKRMVEEM